MILKKPSNSCHGLSFKKLIVTPNIQKGGSYHRSDFRGKCSAFAPWKSRFFHKMPHVRQPKPLLNKVPQISEIQESFMSTYLPLHLQKKSMWAKNWCAGTASSLQTCKWMQIVPCFYHKEFQLLSAGCTPFWLLTCTTPFTAVAAWDAV